MSEQAMPIHLSSGIGSMVDQQRVNLITDRAVLDAWAEPAGMTLPASLGVNIYHRKLDQPGVFGEEPQGGVAVGLEGASISEDSLTLGLMGAIAADRRYNPVAERVARLEDSRDRKLFNAAIGGFVVGAYGFMAQELWAMVPGLAVAVVAGGVGVVAHRRSYRNCLRPDRIPAALAQDPPIRVISRPSTFPFEPRDKV